MSSPTHSQYCAVTSSAATAYLKAIASSATFGNGNNRLALNDPAAGGLHRLSAFSLTPVARRENDEANKVGKPYCNPTGNSPADQSLLTSPYPRSQQSPIIFFMVTASNQLTQTIRRFQIRLNYKNTRASFEVAPP